MNSQAIQQMLLRRCVLVFGTVLVASSGQIEYMFLGSCSFQGGSVRMENLRDLINFGLGLVSCRLCIAGSYLVFCCPSEVPILI